MMNADHEDIVLFPKGLLATVSVMDVPINDCNAFDAMYLLCVAHGQDDVVEDAKAHALVCFGVMTGRANQAIGIRHFP